MFPSTFISRPVRRLLPILVGAATAGAVLASAAPAHAERDVHVDQQQDVRKIDTRTDEQAAVSGRTDPDIRRTAVTHRARRVVVRVEVADLRPDLGHLVAGRIRTADGEVEFGWFKEPGRPMQGGLDLPGGATCDTPLPTFDTDADVVRLVVPRSCLDGPSWVRVGVGLSSFATLATVFVDDARSGHVSSKTVLGPQLGSG